MNLINPLRKKEPDQELLMQQQKKHQQDNIKFEMAHAEGIEDQLAAERQNMLAEIRRWQQDLEPKFLRAFEDLAGVSIQDGKMVKRDFVKATCTVNAAYQLINFCKVTDHNVMRSNYTEHRINLNVREGNGYPLNDIIYGLAESGDIIRKKWAMNYVLHYCINLVEPTYYHALHDGERKHDSQIYKVVRTENDNTEEKKKGLFK